MRLLDARRLTGVNLDLAGPGAVAEVEFEPGDDIDRALAIWRDAVARAVALFAWDAPVSIRRWPDRRGATLAFPAPADALYVAADITEWAVACAIATINPPGGDPARPLDDLAPELHAARERERVPGLPALEAAARAHGVPLLLDDDHLSLGTGPAARTWPRAAAPDASHVPWDSFKIESNKSAAIPIALITGTNGKTTTARLLARIAKFSKHVPGNTSTDGLAVDEQVIDPGDWTGPGAARIVLRDPRVTLAVLEVARGGILRRGLAVDRCDVACVTNVAADHLGEHGIDDVAGMARVKAVVTRVVKPDGRIVLGADSPPLLDLPQDAFPAPVVWFALDRDHPRLRSHRDAGGEVYFLSPCGHLTRGRGHEPDQPLVAVSELPFCFGGAATHNVANALAAAALASALGLPDLAIAAGLRSFSHNPGRAQLVHLGGRQLFLDFAHNPAGIASLAPLLARIRANGRLLVSLGVPGDRRDDDIRDIARTVAALGPDLVLTRDLEHYLRGRAPGEVPAILDATFAALGIATAPVASEVLAIRHGLQWAAPGDLVAILVHVDRDEVAAELRALAVDPPAPGSRTGA